MDRVHSFSLPAEIWARILGFLPSNKQISLKRVSRAWRDLIERNARDEVRRLRYERQLEGASWATTFRVLCDINRAFSAGTLHIRLTRYNVGSCRGTQAVLTTFRGRQGILSFSQDQMMFIWDPVSGKDVRGSRSLRRSSRFCVPLGVLSLWHSRYRVRAVTSGVIDGQRLLYRYLENGILEIWDLDQQVPVCSTEEFLGDAPRLQFYRFAEGALLVSDVSLQGIRVWRCKGTEIFRCPFVEGGANVFTAVSNGLIAINAKGDMQQWLPSSGAQKLGTGLPEARHLAVLGQTPSLRIGIGTLDGDVAIWAGKTRMCEGKHRGPVTALISVSLCGRQLLISGGHDGYLLFHDGETGTQLASVDRYCPILSVVAIPHNKTFLLAVGFLNLSSRGQLEVLGFKGS